MVCESRKWCVILCHIMTKYHKGRAPRTPDFDKSKLNRSQPGRHWMKVPGPVDTAFRDYKRMVNKWPLPKY